MWPARKRTVPVTTTVREANAEEQAVIGRRIELRSRAAEIPRSGGDLRWMGPTFAVAAVGAAIWLARVPSFPAGLTLAMAVMFSVFGFWGARLAARRNAGSLADLERLRVTLGRSI